MARSAKAADALRGSSDNVACSGGPRDGYWYGAKFWAGAVAASHHAGERPHYGRTLGYVLTDGIIAHPKLDQVTGNVARWNPDLAAQQNPTTTPNRSH